MKIKLLKLLPWLFIWLGACLPAWAMLSPANGTNYATAPTNITLSATAADSDGTVTQVAFYSGATLLGTSTAAPYSFSWTNVPGGSYAITAIATDNSGNTTTSGVANISVGTVVKITYLHNDFSGSAIAATDSNGAIVWKENYRPYGDKRNVQAASLSNRQWFHGKPVDEDTGLSYFGARYYDATLGRFMGVDPVTFQAGNYHSFNRYAYGNNNPYKFVDPDGNSPMSVAQMNQVEGAIKGYHACASAGCVKASLSQMVQIRNELIAAGVDPAERSAINANIGQAGVVLGDWGPALAAVGASGIETLKGGANQHGSMPDTVFSTKAPLNVTPGTRTLSGQHINDKGRVEPWTAHYDQYGRQIGRTDYNAGNKAAGVPDTHHHKRTYNSGNPGGKRDDHIPGEY